MTALPFTNFTKGEISPELQARIDTNQYAAAAKKVRNFIIQRYGGLAFRPGFRFVSEVDDVTKEVRYVPFQYNLEQAYIMSLEDERMRLLTGGGVVVEEILDIVSITNEAEAQVEVAFHDYAVGDRLYFLGIDGMEEINDQYVVVTQVLDADNFRINVDTTNYGVFTGTTGTTRVGPPTPPDPDPPPPTPPTPPPDPPPTTGSGGSGADIGSNPSWLIDGYTGRGAIP